MRFRFQFTWALVVLVIQTPEQLSEFLPKLQAGKWAAIDTEADSLHAYPEKLCLLQVSSEGSDVLLDPLGKLDLTPVLANVQGKELILHAADYDLRLLYRAFQFIPESIFDTMWAARLVGCASFGLGHLVHELVGVSLEKGSQKLNWALRPLPEKMAAYALNDTRYLRPLAEHFRSRLEELGRLEWFREVCASVIAASTRPREVDPETVWRLAGSDRLDPRGLAILRELWHWREQEAISANKPPYFVLSHETMLALADAASNDKPLDKLVPRHVSSQRAARLRAALKIGLALPASHYPRPRRSTVVRLNAAQQRRFDALKRVRDARAHELTLDPTIIASKGDLMALARDGTEPNRLMGWQRALLEVSG
jgi:ribonuclease D